MPTIKIKFGSSEYMVDYEYQQAQKGDAETEAIPERFEAKEIREVLNDGNLSGNFYDEFTWQDIHDIEKIIAKEFKN